MMRCFNRAVGVWFSLLGAVASAQSASSPLTGKLVELPLAHSNEVVIELMFENGSMSDPEGKEGLTYATANLIAQGGTSESSYSEIQDLIYPMAASYGAHVDKEVTVFTFRVHRDFLAEFYPIVKGLMLTPAFDDSDYQRLKLNQQNYVDQIIRASSDEEYSKKALEDLLFRGTNYQHMKEGKSASVRDISLEEIKEHYRNVFTRNNLRIGIAGNYSPEFREQLLADMSELSEQQPRLPSPGVARHPDGIQVEIIAKPGAFGSAIFTGSPLGITRADDEFAALMVANSWLGEHRKSYSRLYQKLRESRSMNYGDYTYIEWYEDGGRNMLPPPGVPRRSNYFSIWIRPVQIAVQLKQQYPELADITIGHAHFALRMAIKELAALVKEGLSEEEFEATRTFLRSYTRLYAQTPAARLGYLMDSHFYGREDYLAELDDLLAELTADDVNDAIRKYWQADDMFVMIVTAVSEAEPLAESLLNNTPSPMTYSNLVLSGLSDEIKAEDELVANYPLNVTSVTIVKSEDTFK
jgi:zinc protease